MVGQHINMLRQIPGRTASPVIIYVERNLGFEAGEYLKHLHSMFYIMISYPHPFIYTFLHQIKFSILPSPYRYTPTHAPGYWIDTATRSHKRPSNITKLQEPFPYPLRKSTINSMREVDCLMVAPGVLVVEAPPYDETKSLFHRMDAHRIFKDCAPGELLMITGVKPYELIGEPLKHYPSLLWPFIETETKVPGICLTCSAGSTWKGPEVGVFEIDLSLPNSPKSPQSTTSEPSVPSQERHSTATVRPTAWAF